MHAVVACHHAGRTDGAFSLLSNHDFPRFAGTHTDSVLTRNAAVFPFVNDGFPIVYQGQEHVSPTKEQSTLIRSIRFGADHRLPCRTYKGATTLAIVKPYGSMATKRRLSFTPSSAISMLRERQLSITIHRIFALLSSRIKLTIILWH